VTSETLATPLALLPNSVSFGPNRVAILDTDYLLDQIACMVNTPHSAQCSFLPPFSHARAFASAHVLRELYQPDKLGNRNKWEKLAVQAAKQGKTTQALHYESCFEQFFLPKITFVDVRGICEDAEPTRAVYEIDPHDAPTGQLIGLLSRTRPMVYSRDKSFRRPKLAPAFESREAVLTAEFHLGSLEFFVSGSIYVAEGTLRTAEAIMCKAVEMLRVPPWVLYFFLAGGAFWYLRDRKRRDGVLDTFRSLGQLMQCLGETATKELLTLASGTAQVEPGNQLECYIAEVLAQLDPHEALTAAEIQDHIASWFHPQCELPSPAEIRTLMRELPCFVEGPAGRFHLGQTYETMKWPTKTALLR
jgi:hypothetical protein